MFRVEGKENIPQKSNFIVSVNHASFLDPLCIMVAIPRKIYCIASHLLYKIFIVGWFLRNCDAIPEGKSSKKAVELLNTGKVVGLFPEGGVSHDGKLREFKRGAALLAYRTGRPILPCVIIGSYKALSFRAKFPRFFTPIKVKIGKPIYLLKEAEEIIDDLQLQEGTFKIRNVMKEMLYAG